MMLSHWLNFVAATCHRCVHTVRQGCSRLFSRIDYCNSILYGLPTVEHEKLQRVQNIAARLITGSSRRDHITPVLKNLHWLPVQLRITFKILLLTYKILNGQSPSYFTSLICSYKPVRSLRSSDHLLLQVPNVLLRPETMKQSA